MQHISRRVIRHAWEMTALSSRTQLRHLTEDPAVPLAPHEVIPRLTECKQLSNSGEEFTTKKAYVASACAYFRSGCYDGSATALVAYQEVLIGRATSLVLDLLLENEFCGSTKDYVLSWADDVNKYRPDFVSILGITRSDIANVSNSSVMLRTSWNRSHMRPPTCFHFGAIRGPIRMRRTSCPPRRTSSPLSALGLLSSGQCCSISDGRS